MISYLKIGAVAVVVVLLAGMYGLMKHYEASAASAKAEQEKAIIREQVAKRDRDTAVATNKELAADNDNLQEALNRANRITSQYLSRLDEIDAAITQQNKALTELGETDEPTRTYLDTDVPDAFRLQLNPRR